MEFKIYEAAQNDTVFRIEEDHPEIGAYLYIVQNGECIKDYLQNSIDICKTIALDEYGVSLDSWRLIKEKCPL